MQSCCLNCSFNIYFIFLHRNISSIGKLTVLLSLTQDIDENQDVS